MNLFDNMQYVCRSCGKAINSKGLFSVFSIRAKHKRLFDKYEDENDDFFLCDKCRLNFMLPLKFNYGEGYILYCMDEDKALFFQRIDFCEELHEYIKINMALNRDCPLYSTYDINEAAIFNTKEEAIRQINKIKAFTGHTGNWMIIRRKRTCF